MPFSFINTVASWMLKKRMHQIELFVKYPIDVQNEELKKVVQQAKNTEFGKNMIFPQLIIIKLFLRESLVLLMRNFFQQ